MIERPIDEQVRRVARTYGAAADHYCEGSLGFWDRFGAATVSQLALAPGQVVLDLCCGAGASAIPAARAVGPMGTVLGVDVAAPLLDVARARAEREGLANLALRLADARSTQLPSRSFGAAVCVFGVFFAPDMPAFVAEMWRLVRSGGRLALTTWGPGLFEPANSVFWEAVRAIEPSLFKAFNPWDEVTTSDSLQRLLKRSGVIHATVRAASGRHSARPSRRLLGGRARLWLPGDDRASHGRPTRRAPRPPPAQAQGARHRTLRTDVVFGIAERPADS